MDFGEETIPSAEELKKMFEEDEEDTPKLTKKEKEKKDVDNLVEGLGKEEFNKMYAKMHTPWINKYKSIRPNDPCPCGSGKKFKNCCRDKITDKYIKG